VPLKLDEEEGGSWVYGNNTGYTSRLQSAFAYRTFGGLLLHRQSDRTPSDDDSCHYYNLVISLISTGKEKKTCRKIVCSDLWSGWAIARSN
jgi:hypothetical protein